MPESNNQDKEIEKLSKTIVEVILKSKEVKKILSKLSDQGSVSSDSFMILMLKVQSLTEASTKEDSRKKSTVPKRKKVAKKSSEPKQTVDGVTLSQKEMSFLEYCVEQFNEEEWMKRNRISLKLDPG